MATVNLREEAAIKAEQSSTHANTVMDKVHAPENQYQQSSQRGKSRIELLLISEIGIENGIQQHNQASIIIDIENIVFWVERYMKHKNNCLSTSSD